MYAVRPDSKALSHQKSKGFSENVLLGYILHTKPKRANESCSGITTPMHPTTEKLSV